VKRVWVLISALVLLVGLAALPTGASASKEELVPCEAEGWSAIHA
jgi:hypothetical protein